jgi:hypothetical protein
MKFVAAMLKDCVQKEYSTLIRVPELQILQGEFLPFKFSVVRSFITQHRKRVDYALTT